MIMVHITYYMKYSGIITGFYIIYGELSKIMIKFDKFRFILFLSILQIKTIKENI